MQKSTRSMYILFDVAGHKISTIFFTSTFATHTQRRYGLRCTTFITGFVGSDDVV